jgi:hypothetical protein
MSDSKVRQLTPDDSVEDFIDAIVALSASATFDSVIDAFLNIKDKAARKSVVMASLIACRAVKKLVKELEQFTGKIHSSFNVESGPNMTMLTMLGHLFHCNTAELSPAGILAFTQYRETINGATTIFAFSGAIDGKAKRTEVLRQTAAKAKPKSSRLDDISIQFVIDFPILFASPPKVAVIPPVVWNELVDGIFSAYRARNANPKNALNVWELPILPRQIIGSASDASKTIILPK